MASPARCRLSRDAGRSVWPHLLRADDVSQCITCERWNLRDAGSMAVRGFGLCKLAAKWRFFGGTHERECKHHAPAEERAAAKRVKWFNAIEKQT